MWREVLFEEEVGGATTDSSSNNCYGLHDVVFKIELVRPYVLASFLVETVTAKQPE